MGSLDSPVPSASADYDVDLAIIGGGPTGLLSALLAEHLGLTVCVIDAKPSSLELGRADALNARTQQCLEVAGCLDEILPKGIKCNSDFVSRQSHWWTGLQHCLHKNFLMIGQPDIERVLVSHIKTLVNFGERVVAVEEAPAQVITTTDSGRVVRSRYAIASDGARSFVRTALDISFKGSKPEMVWAVLDTFLDTDFPVCNEIITFQLNGQSRVSWIPRERGLARFYVLLPEDGEITQERAEASIKEHLAPYRIDFVKTEWFSTFEVKERIASTFISKNGEGRIILAGDAAHVHSVNGGQGLNTGIADAFALAWRLGIAIKDGDRVSALAERKLVQSYDIERRKVAQGVIDVAAKLVRDTVHTAKQYVSTIERNAAYITGMGVCYDGLDSPLISESESGEFKAGKRCPDMVLTLRTASDEVSDQRLYSLSSGHYGKYILLVTGPPNAPFEVEFRALANRFKEHARILRIMPSGSSKEAGKQNDSLPPAYNASPDFPLGTENCVVVVRPDMYIGFVGRESDKGWIGYMEQVFN